MQNKNFRRELRDTSRKPNTYEQEKCTASTAVGTFTLFDALFIGFLIVLLPILL